MDSRLWTNPPTKPDGTLDYSQLTPAEVCEDLTESLSDRVDNSGIDDLQPLLDAVPEVESLLTEGVSPEALVAFMEKLKQLEVDDVDFRKPQTHEVIRQAAEQLQRLADKETI